MSPRAEAQELLDSGRISPLLLDIRNLLDAGLGTDKGADFIAEVERNRRLSDLGPEIGGWVMNK